MTLTPKCVKVLCNTIKSAEWRANEKKVVILSGIQQLTLPLKALVSFGSFPGVEGVRLELVSLLFAHAGHY